VKSNVSFTGKFSPNFKLKNMISPIQGFFHGKNDPNSPDFEDSFLKIARFL
jgi:hypothetical protein